MFRFWANRGMNVPISFKIITIMNIFLMVKKKIESNVIILFYKCFDENCKNYKTRLTVRLAIFQFMWIQIVWLHNT